MESGVAPVRREHDGKRLVAAFGLVVLGLAAAVAIIVNHQSAVSLEEVIVHGLDAHSQHPIGGASARLCTCVPLGLCAFCACVPVWTCACA